MSNLFDSNNNNPYATTLVSPQQQPPSIQAGLPGFCTTMFVISLIFSILRVLSTGLSIVGLYMISKSGSPSPLGISAIWEVVTGAGMMLFGIIGNSLMLARKPVGIYFGILLVFCVLGSFLVAAFQLVTLFNVQSSGGAGLPGQQAPVIGMMIGASVAVVFRFALLAAYVFALIKFKRWCEVNC